MSAFFDVAAEQARYLAREPLLERALSLRLELAPGIVFQPETQESVEDQVVETLWAEGKTLGSIDAAEEAEVRASFSVLAPRRESGELSLAASLLFGLPVAERDQKLEALRGFPEQLTLELRSGAFVTPAVDRGAAGPGDRLPAVLALRYQIPPDDLPVALVSVHGALSGRFEPAGSWAGWLP
ncbi:MAG: hypothetical protein IPQ13_04080 [Holophagaceae bacterium]|nr:hypothetical protein [Holophagaceae bacterium]